MGEPPDDVKISPDGLWWWDGASWQPTEALVLGGGKLSGGSPDIRAGDAVLLTRIFHSGAETAVSRG